MKSVVEQYNRDLAEWERQTNRKPTDTSKEQHKPPEKQSVLKHLREIQERNRQKPPQRQRKKSFDRDSDRHRKTAVIVLFIAAYIV